MPGFALGTWVAGGARLGVYTLRCVGTLDVWVHWVDESAFSR